MLKYLQKLLSSSYIHNYIHTLLSEQYIHEIQCRNCDPKAEPTVEDEFTSVAVVNGNNGMGPITGKFCMDIAMEKALGSGIGMVAAKVK